jgi:hypothetical protein
LDLPAYSAIHQPPPPPRNSFAARAATIAKDKRNAW